MNKISILKPDCIFGIVILMVCAILLPSTFQLPSGVGPNLGSAFFPRLIMAGMSLLAIILIARGWKIQVDPADVRDTPASFLRPLALFGCMVAYVLVMPLLGYYLATAVCLAACLFLFRTSNWSLNLATIAGFLLFVFVVFDLILSVLLPRSSLISL